MTEFCGCGFETENSPAMALWLVDLYLNYCTSILNQCWMEMHKYACWIENDGDTINRLPRTCEFLKELDRASIICGKR